MQYNGKLIDPTLLTFVDDIAELTIDEQLRQGEESPCSEEPKRQVEENTSTLAPALASSGCEFELSQKVVVPVWTGTGALIVPSNTEPKQGSLLGRRAPR